VLDVGKNQQDVSYFIECRGGGKKLFIAKSNKLNLNDK
jgi:hypothetical protein